jgi:hypothetical protein
MKSGCSWKYRIQMRITGNEVVVTEEVRKSCHAQPPDVGPPPRLPEKRWEAITCGEGRTAASHVPVEDADLHLQWLTVSLSPLRLVSILTWRHDEFEYNGNDGNQ